MKSDNLKGSLILVLTAFIWGIAFVAQNRVSDAIPPFLVNCLRSFISAVFLFIIIAVYNSLCGKPILFCNLSDMISSLKGGLLCGCMLAISVNFQQFGIAMYPKGAAVEAHSGFITALYVIIVPVIARFTGKRINPQLWISIILTLTGFYFLCFSDGTDGLYIGDLLIFCCAISLSLHIIAVDVFAEKVGGLRLSMLQFLFCGIISGVLSIIFEHDKISASGINNAILPILYLGIVSSGIGYTLQIIGQRFAEPAMASLTMSLESVFAALGGWFVGNILQIGSKRNLSISEIFGCTLVFSAIILAQIPIKNKKKCIRKS